MKRILRYVIVTPVRDEAAYIGRTIEAVTSQTLVPAQWVVVDDGSTDGTGAILDKHASEVQWMSVVHRKNRGHRAAGSGVVEAFYAGYSVLETDTWDFLVKLDGDLSFAPDYFEQCARMFAVDAKLGIGGGTVCQREGGTLRVDSPGDPRFHVRGATKIYRRACWDTISPLVSAPGWDTIDEVRANQHGWATRTFPDVRLVQHKPTGSAEGCWRDSFKNGRANYMSGYHPVFMMGKCLKRMVRKPMSVDAVALFIGYWSGHVRRVPPAASRDGIRYLRQQQVRHLLRRSSIYA